MEFNIAAGVAAFFFLLSWYLLAIRRGLAMQASLLFSFLTCLLFCRLPTLTELTHISGTIFFYLLVWAGQVNWFVKLIAGDQLRKEWACYLAEFEAEPTDPGEFTWLDLGFYDEKQRELEALGVNKVRDYELLHFTRAFPEMRNFSRILINAERDIEVSVTQTKFVKPKTFFERHFNNYIVEFCSEFSNGSFLNTNNAQGINPLGNMEGYTFQQFPPDTPLADILEAHESEVESICERNDVTVLSHPTERDMLASGARQHLILRRDRQKKGGFTLQEMSEITDFPADEGAKAYIAEYRKQAEKIIEQEQDKQRLADGDF